jgi:hypothetical protein
MNWKYLFIGIGLLIVAYLIYRGVKGGPASERNNWDGPIPSLYVQGWGAIILCVLTGIVLILKSLPV